MKVYCSQIELAKGLDVLRYKRPQDTPYIPIAQDDVLLATDNGQLKLAINNLELSIVHRVDAQVEEDGAVIVSLYDLIKSVSCLPSDRQVMLAVDPEELTLTVSSGATSMVLQGTSTDEFPKVPETKNVVTVKANDLRKGLKRVTFAASLDKLHPALTGVLMEFDANILTLVATDGFRLSMHYISFLQPVTHPFNIIVQAWMLEKLSHMLFRHHNESVTISVTEDNNWVTFTFGDTSIGVKPISCAFPNYPNYRLIISSLKHNTRVTVNRKEWLQACKQARVFTRSTAFHVRLHLGDGKVVMSTTCDKPKDFTTVNAVVEGESLDIVFNVHFLIDVLDALNAPEVILLVSKPKNPGVIKVLGDEDAFMHVIMPVLPR